MNNNVSPPTDEVELLKLQVEGLRVALLALLEVVNERDQQTHDGVKHSESVTKDFFKNSLRLQRKIENGKTLFPSEAAVGLQWVIKNY